jgi:MFS family permease
LTPAARGNLLTESFDLFLEPRDQGVAAVSGLGLRVRRFGVDCLKRGSHDLDVRRRHLGERRLVERRALELDDDRLEPFAQGGCPGALELERLERLSATLGPRDRLTIHGVKDNRGMPPRTRSARAVLTGASAAQAAVSFVSFGLPAIGPQLRHAYGLSLPELGAVLTANLLGAGLALIGAGIAIDRFGSLAAVLAGTALAGGGLVAAAEAHSGAVLFGGLLVSGIGSAVVPIAGAGALFRAYAPGRRAWALGVRQMAVPLGGTVSAAALPGLEAVGGVRLALLVGAGIVCVTGIVLALVLGADARPVVRSTRAFRSILRAAGMQRLLVVACCYVIVLQALISYTVPSVRAAGFSSFWASATYVAVNVTAMVARIVWGRVADRAAGGRRARTLVETGAVAAVGALLFTAALHTSAAEVLLAALVFGFGALGWNAILYVSAGESAPVELAGRSFAVAATVVFVVSGICTPPLGALAAHAGWDAFWITTAGLAAVGALIAAYLPRSLPTA